MLPGARKAGASGVAATVLAKISLRSSSRRKSGRSGARRLQACRHLRDLAGRRRGLRGRRVPPWSGSFDQAPMFTVRHRPEVARRMKDRNLADSGSYRATPP